VEGWVGVCEGESDMLSRDLLGQGLFFWASHRHRRVWVISMNLAKASPPAFVLKRMLIDSVGDAGMRNESRASLK
jgi:hypothetical protein